MLLKQKIYTSFYGSSNNRASLKLELAIATLIILNVFAVLLETVETIGTTYKETFYAFELFSVLVFSVEYIARLWVSNLIPRYQPPNGSRLSYIF